MHPFVPAHLRALKLNICATKVPIHEEAHQPTESLLTTSMSVNADSHLLDASAFTNAAQLGNILRTGGKIRSMCVTNCSHVDLDWHTLDHNNLIHNRIDEADEKMQR